jgi:hypothetical protein
VYFFLENLSKAGQKWKAEERLLILEILSMKDFKRDYLKSINCIRNYLN